VADTLASVLITTGGVGTIVALMGVGIFLLWVAIPLFQPAVVENATNVLPGASSRGPLRVDVDEYQTLAWLLAPDGRIEVAGLTTGELLWDERLETGERALTAVSPSNRTGDVVLGFADGTIELRNIGFRTSYPEADRLPAEIRAKLEGPSPDAAAGVPWERGWIQRGPQGGYRLQELVIEEPPPPPTLAITSAPVLLVDHLVHTRGSSICALTGTAGAYALTMVNITLKENFATGEQGIEVGAPRSLPFEPLAPGEPAFMALAGEEPMLYVAWRSGEVLRLNCADPLDPFIAEVGRLVPRGTSLTALGLLLGDNTLVWGDSKGRVKGGFLVRQEDFKAQPQKLHDRRCLDMACEASKIRYRFIVTKHLAERSSPLRSLAFSKRSRLAALGFEDGEVHLINVSTEQLVACFTVPSPRSRSVIGLSMAPKEDGLLALTADGGFHFRLDTRHPEAGYKSFFLPVWYERYAAPSHMWQTGGASDDTEPKLGLIPLIFGTIKAALYALLFGAPIALMAAVYSSEFLHRRVRAVIKPSIELLASLPSVVLGVLAALVLAPFVERTIPTVLMFFLCVPIAFFCCAYFWQLLPAGFTRPLGSWRPIVLIVPLLAGILLATLLGPLMERLFFAGDMRGWLAWNPAIGADPAGRFASSLGGWFYILLPLCWLGAALSTRRFITPLVGHRIRGRGRATVAWIDISKFFLATLTAVLAALALAMLLDAFNLDLRGNWLLLGFDLSPMRSYVQQNALIVGVVMGFAILPIIYTLADDALSAVPEHLRSAALGAGATQWQTAVTVVIPTAMGGLFSALMIGLGRAVGETMIVLMALDNTAILDLNIFGGARTLSANIADELRLAVHNSTHYRTLFLAALVLFTMTFIVNMIAELVRLRSRRRASNL